ncbi:DUF881 domain-containing protein [Rugosimonospora africana]|uniref:Membrane protein n=1 Tax=Rugosimonospora africana TaxID=556532 RepID=A0A8J3QLQ8_9ACTN|nr:DUF881 domain-containing protein [Rugosimonospora africana]GIH13274.1 membrane protein [Rugosimonospora africana]
MEEYTSGTSSWREAFRRVGLGLLHRRRRRPTAWSALVPVVALLTGMLLTTSAHTAQGTALRDDRTPQLSNLIADRKRQIDQLDKQESGLRDENNAKTDQVGSSDADTAREQSRADSEKASAGLSKVHGPGLTIKLNDAPKRADGSLPPGAHPDDVVVHQQDVQAVVNALWAGGAEAMTIMGVRVISTSAVRCVGNTLLLNGRVYSPPFEITAIGDPDQLQAALDASSGVHIYREAVAAFGLGYGVQTRSDVTLPAYDGSTDLQFAHTTG